MSDKFDLYLSQANFDIQNMEEHNNLKEYVACLLCDNDEKDKEIERLNNIINELEEWLEDLDKYTTTMSSVIYIDNMRDKLKQLKEGEKNVKN